jgi:GntR family transcriptional regulator
VPRTKHEADQTLPAALTWSRPKGEQLREILDGLVQSMRPDDLLPSERVLATRFDVARMTVRQEIDRMVREGLVYRRHGHGTFVAGPKLVQSDTLVSFSQDMRARGMTPSGRVLSVVVEPAPEHIAARLEIPLHAHVVRMVRLRTADGVPMALERTNLPAERFPGLEELDLSEVSLWNELERRWGVRMGSTEQRISAVLPSRHEALMLEMEATQPGFATEGVTRDLDGVVVEYGRSLYRGDRYDVLRHAHRAR